MENIEDIVLKHLENKEFEEIYQIIENLDKEYQEDFIFDVFYNCCSRNNFEGFKFFEEKYNSPDNASLFPLIVGSADLDFIVHVSKLFNDNSMKAYSWGLQRAMKEDRMEAFIYIWNTLNVKEKMKNYNEKLYKKAHTFSIANKAKDF